MSENAVGLTIAIIVATLVGPVIGVFTAWVFARKESHRKAAFDISAKVYDDIQEYRSALLLCYSSPSNKDVLDNDLALSDYRRIQAKLNTDILLLEIVFGRESNGVCDMLGNLARMGEILVSPNDDRSDRILVEAQVDKLIQQIASGIKPLYESTTAFFKLV